MVMVCYQLFPVLLAMVAKVYFDQSFSFVHLKVTRELCPPSGFVEAWHMLCVVSSFTLVAGIWVTT